MSRKKPRKKQTGNSSVLGVIFVVVSLLILLALLTYHPIDSARISGQVDGHLSPFEIQYHNQAGLVGAFISLWLIGALGWLSYFLPLGLLIWGLKLFRPSISGQLKTNTALLFAISLMGTMVFNIHLLARRTIGLETGAGGGYLSESLTHFSLKVIGELGSYLLLCGLALVLVMTYTSVTPVLASRIRIPGFSRLGKLYFSVVNFFDWAVSLVGKGEDNDEDDFYEYEEVETNDQNGRESRDYSDSHNPFRAQSASSRISSSSATPQRRTILRRKAEPVQIRSVEYNYPGIDLLTVPTDSGETITPEELSFSARMLKETLETFGVKIDGEIDRFPGPVITRYEFRPAAGVKVNQIIGLADDLALAMKAKRIRIIAPIPGKAAVGVEIPNRQPQMVHLRDIIDSEQYNDPSIILPLALGKTTSGKPYITDLAKMPHLLIAGSTGSGKSVCMNILITSLMYRLHPYRIRFIFIDPKMLELSVYSGIPHLGRPVVTKPRRAEKVLADSVVEMEKRYKRLADASVRNIEDYNKKQEKEEDKLPYIIIMVDELADLMMASTSSKIEMLLTRLAQMARAVGIHIILATQRPSVDVLTGLIKANFPARIAFQVASKVDSRTILDGNGAEKLLGNGDMLFLGSGQAEATRIHGAYVSGDDTDNIVSFVKDQGLSMQLLEGISQASGDVQQSEVDLGDPLFREACEVVIRHKQGSVSLLQRRLGIGYQRAARLIDKLEQAGVVSTFDGSKARDVMVDRSYLETMFGKQPEPAGGERD